MDSPKVNLEIQNSCNLIRNKYKKNLPVYHPLNDFGKSKDEQLSTKKRFLNGTDMKYVTPTQDN